MQRSAIARPNQCFAIATPRKPQDRALHARTSCLAARMESAIVRFANRCGGKTSIRPHHCA
eukprot:9310142-Lingulodinium_polyedra.AAC.1